MALSSLKQNNYIEASYSPSSKKRKAYRSQSVYGNHARLIYLDDVALAEISFPQFPPYGLMVGKKGNERTCPTEQIDRESDASSTNWVLVALTAVSIASAALLIVSLLSFLLEVNSGAGKFILPSFSAILLFSVVFLISVKLKQAAKQALRDG